MNRASLSRLVLLLGVELRSLPCSIFAFRACQSTLQLLVFACSDHRRNSWCGKRARGRALRALCLRFPDCSLHISLLKSAWMKIKRYIWITCDWLNENVLFSQCWSNSASAYSSNTRRLNYNQLGVNKWNSTKYRNFSHSWESQDNWSLTLCHNTVVSEWLIQQLNVRQMNWF